MVGVVVKSVVGAVVVVVATVVVVVGIVVVVVGIVVVVVAIVVGLVVVVLATSVVIGCVIVVVGSVSGAVVVESVVGVDGAGVDWVTLVVALVPAAATVGAGGRTVVPATDGRGVVVLGFRPTGVRRVVLGLGGAAIADDGGAAVSSGGAVTGAVTDPAAVTESSVENKKGSVVVEDVVVDATSNCRAFGGPESAQPTSAIPAAKSPSGRRTTRGITAEYYPLSARLPLALVTPNGPARAWGHAASWTPRHHRSRR